MLRIENGNDCCEDALERARMMKRTINRRFARDGSLQSKNPKILRPKARHPEWSTQKILVGNRNWVASCIATPVQIFGKILL